ncbi:hypothetical protein L1987_20999 [Smallanthus sonchifolius]|uniref:Uncharacterized protein n=1 Tax=Smallanthus sonchifolius TaxID=185202 RepID=A0ACB9IUU5_9ASTR|nr:hypothetical protein L1987_20999 [Smallanthus sonchifolius]
MEKDDEISKFKKEKNKSLTLKAKQSKSSSEIDDDQSNSDDGEENSMMVKEFKKFFRRNGKFVSDNPDENDQAKEETCLMAFSTNESKMGQRKKVSIEKPQVVK